MSDSKIIAYNWFTSALGTIGVVIIRSGGLGEYKAYMSTVIGTNEERDLQFIADYGAKIDLEAAEILCNFTLPKTKN